MLSLLVLLVLVIAGSYLMKEKLGIGREDTDIMWFGIVAFGGLEALARLIVGLATGAAGAALLTYLIMTILYGAFGYYLFNRSGL